jgi:signal transduction histidine kinase
VGARRAEDERLTILVFEASGLVAALVALWVVLKRSPRPQSSIRLSLGALLAMFAFNHLANLLEAAGFVWADTIADQLSLMVPVLWGLFLLETGRAYIAERLRASDEQVRFFLENVPASVAWLDADVMLVGYSQAFGAALPKSAPGVPLGKVLPVPLPELSVAIACCLSGSGDTGLTEEAVEDGESRRYFRWSVRLWLHPDRPEPGMLLLLEELTEEREAETQRLLAADELARTQRLADVGQLAAGAAHDFNNFLQIIHSALWDLDLDPRPQTQVALANIRQALDSAGTMTRALLHFGSGQSSPAGLVDLRALLLEIEGPLTHALGRRHRLTIDLPGAGNLQVWGLASRLQQALLNLAVNARDAMPRGGTIRVAVAVDGGEVVLSVSDSGVGMSEAVQSRLFTPFFTTKGALGTGLGLRVVRGAIEEHHGSVAVESQPGVGTTFRLRLPLFEPTGDDPSRLS